MKTIFKKGFTLIELLVVIGVLAVVASGVVALINPRDKILQAADSKVQNDIGQLATALQSFAAQNTNGFYPAALTELGPLGSNELTLIPVPPTQNAAYTLAYTYDQGTSSDQALVAGRVMSAKYDTVACAAGVNAYWTWSSFIGRACGVCAAGIPNNADTNYTCTF